MVNYKIGAQKYRIIPSYLKDKLATLNLGYHNFLKEYLNYFDTLNLIMAMAFYEKLSAKIFELSHFKDIYHLGGTSHGTDNSYRTYITLKFLEMSQNQLLREKYTSHISSFDSSRDMVNLFPDEINSRNFIRQTDQLVEKLEKSLSK